MISNPVKNNNPERIIDAGAIAVHGITNQDVIVYRYWSENNSELYEFRLPHGRIKDLVQEFINKTKA